MEGSGKPYKDIEINGNGFLRIFEDDIDPIELMWHRDDEDRLIESIEKTDWQIQFDNKLPTLIENRIFIKRHEWHRVIKGTGKLKLKIHKNG